MVDLLNDVVVLEFYSVINEGIGGEFMKVEMLKLVFLRKI